MVGNSGRSSRARWASRRTSNGLCRAGVLVGERRDPVAHRGVAGAMASCAGPRARGRWRRARRRSPPVPRRGRGRASRPRPPSASRRPSRSAARRRAPRGRLGVEVDGRVQERARGRDDELGAAVAQAAEQVEAVLEVVDPDVAAVDDPGEQPLVLEPALVGDQLDVLRALALHDPVEVGSASMEVEPDALDGQVAQHAVGVADVVEVGLDADPGALVDLGQLLVGEPQRVELALGAVLDEAGLVELHPGRALPGQALEHLAVDLEQRLEQVEAVEVLGDPVGGLAEQQERDRPDEHRHGVDPELLLASACSSNGFVDDSEKLRLGPELGDDVVVVGVEPLGHLHRGDVDAALLAAARHREVGVEVDRSPPSSP